LFIDEIQDFGGHDFNFLKSIAESNLDLLFVGDFYQHTFDTSRDGNVNKNLHSDLNTFINKLQQMGLVVDCGTLCKSYRCSSTVCSFITQDLGIKMESHRNEGTTIHFLETQAEADKILKCNQIIKHFYREHYKYTDVCVVLNKTTFQKYQKSQLRELKPQTRNKLYVACSRARNNVYLVPEVLYKRHLKNN
jgi:DNA helicase-2/ATP-dependent DNA helicase PcrA